jgi:hypothetical protein
MDIDSNLPVRAAAGDVVVNLLNASGATMNPASEGTSIAILAGITGVSGIVATEATQLAVLAGITALAADNGATETTALDILAGVTGIEAKVATEATLLEVLAGVTNASAGLALEATQKAVLAGVTGVEAIVATEVTLKEVLTGVTGAEASLITIKNSVANIPVKGQTGMASSMPVVLASNQSPIGVFITDAVSAQPIVEFATAEAVASGATMSNQVDAGSDWILNNVQASGSGRIKVIVRAAPTLTLDNASAIHFVAFNSTANPNVHIDCSDYSIDSTWDTRVDVINYEPGKAQDLYSTIVGNKK